MGFFKKRKSERELANELRTLRNKRLKEEGYNKLRAMQKKERSKLAETRLARLGLGKSNRKKFSKATKKIGRGLNKSINQGMKNSQSSNGKRVTSKFGSGSFLTGNNDFKTRSTSNILFGTKKTEEKKKSKPKTGNVTIIIKK